MPSMAAFEARARLNCVGSQIVAFAFSSFSVEHVSVFRFRPCLCCHRVLCGMRFT